MKFRAIQACKWIGGAVVLVLFLLAAMFALAQTEAGKLHLGRWMAGVLSTGPDTQVRLGKLEGMIPLNVTLESLDISDREGPWLRARDLALRWSPAALLRGRVHIREIRAGMVRLERLPPRGKCVTDRDRDRTLPAVLSVLPPAIIEHMAVDSLELGAAVAGQAASFAITGGVTARDAASGLAGHLNIQRIDAPGTCASISWVLEGEPPVLTINALAEDDGSMIFTGLGLKPAVPLSIRMQGRGPLRGWEGHLSAQADGVVELDASVMLHVSGNTRVRAEGSLWASSPLLPARLASLVPRVDGSFSLELMKEDGWTLNVRRAAVYVEGIEAALRGRLDLSRLLVQSAFSVEIRNLSPFAELMGTEARGTLSAQGTATGPVRKPNVRITMRAEEVEIAAVTARRMEGDFSCELLESVGKAFPGLEVMGTGLVEGLEHKGGHPLPETGFRWSITARIPSEGAVAVHTLELTGEKVNAALSGQFDPPEGSFSGQIRGDLKDLSRFSALLGRQMTGSISFSARLDGDISRGTLEADCRGDISGLGPLPPWVSHLAESGMTFEGRASLTEDSRVCLSDFRIRSRTARVTLNSNSDMRGRSMTTSARVELPDLAALPPLKGQSLGGYVEMEVGATGPFHAPVLEVSARGRRLMLGTVQFSQAAAQFNIEGLPERPRGRMELEVQSGEHVFQAGGRLVLEENRLTISELVTTASDTRVTGALHLDFDTLLAEGTLEGRSEDIGIFSGCTGEEIRGSARFRVRLSPGAAGQDIALQLQARSVATRLGKMDTLEVKADYSDIFGTPQGTGRISLTAFRRDGLTLDRMEVSVAGSTRNAAFTGSASGRLGESFALKAQGSLEAEGTDGRLLLWLLRGRYGKHTITLQRPVAIALTDEAYAIERGVFVIDDARIALEGTLHPDKADIGAEFDSVPLEILRFSWLPDFIGSASGRIRVTGTPDRPEAVAALRAEGVRVMRGELEELPPASVTVDAALQGGRARAVLRLRGLTTEPVEATLSVPLALSLLPLALALPREGDVSVEIRASGSMEHILALFLPEDQKTEGAIMLEAGLSGSIEDPVVTGTCRVEKGHYEHLRTGTVLKDISIELTAGEGKIFIQHACATDGGEGRVSARGWLDVSPDGNSPLNVEISMKKVALIRQDALSATVDGQLNMSGTQKGPVVSGRVSVGPAELYIFDFAPPEVSALDIVEINTPRPASQPSSSFSLSQASQVHPREVRLDLEITSPGRVFLRGRGLDCEWEGALRVRGSTREPVVIGTLTLVRGRYNLFGKSFALTGGTIVFDGTVPIAPTFEVTGKHPLADMTALVRFSGDRSGFHLALESEPPMPQDEVLSRLLFGRGVASITPMQALRLAAALKSLGGGGGAGEFDIMDRARRLLRMDQLDVRQREEAGGEAAVSLGKYVREDVYVELEQGVGSESGKAKVEVELTPSFTIESEAGVDGKGGIGLNWKRDY